VQQVLREYQGKIRLVIKYYPYRYRHFSYLAAQAAEAAKAQGKFWAMHDIMLETKKLDRESLIQHAKTIGLDVPRFTKDLDSEKYRERVEQDVALARSLDFYQTPTFVINGRVLVGDRPIEKFREYIDEALKDEKGKP
jgi:predicted DsbA family dithiol-disulfide isomerase